MANRTKRSFWKRNLAATKVREALVNMGAVRGDGDLEEFEKAYAATRRRAGLRKFTEGQVASLQAFSGNGRDIESLATELGVKVPTARGFVARAVEQGLI